MIFTGSVLPAIGLVTLAYMPKNIYVVETILVLICATKVSSHMGFQVSILIYNYINFLLSFL